MPVIRRLACWLLLAALTSASASGEARRKVSVVLDLRDKPFAYTFPDVGLIAARVTPSLAEELGQWITFVDFAPRAAPGEGPVLHIRVGCADPNAPRFGACDVVSSLRLEGDGWASSSPVTWRYKEGVPFVQKCSGLEPEEFERQLAEELRGAIRHDHRTLIERLFSELDILHEALPVADAHLWILPLSRAELRVDEGTVFEIRPQVPDYAEPPSCRTRSTVLIPSTGLPAPYDRGVQARIDDDEANEGCRRAHSDLATEPLNARVRIQFLVPRRGPVPPRG